MRPDVAEAFDRMSAAAQRDDISLVITSAFRSDAEQAELWEQNPEPRWVAPPGTSLHRCATELDLGPASAYGWLAANASRFHFLKRSSPRGSLERLAAGTPEGRSSSTPGLGTSLRPARRGPMDDGGLRHGLRRGGGHPWCCVTRGLTRAAPSWMTKSHRARLRHPGSREGCDLHASHQRRRVKRTRGYDARQARDST
jgi:hypothetical protein